MQHTIYSAIFSATLYCQYIKRILYYANRAFVPVNARADFAKICIAYVIANRAHNGMFFKQQKTLSKLVQLILRHMEEVKCETLCSLWSNTRKFLKTFNKLFYGSWDFHGCKKT